MLAMNPTSSKNQFWDPALHINTYNALHPVEHAKNLAESKAKNAINQAILDAKEQTLADAMIETLRLSILNLDDGIYKKTYIDNTITYLENLLISKASPEIVASIAEAKIAVATAEFEETARRPRVVDRSAHRDGQTDRGQDADGRDRQGRFLQLGSGDHGRADVVADQGRGRTVVPDHSSLARARQGDHLHFAQDGRDLRDLGRSQRAAGWTLRGDLSGQGTHDRQTDLADGRTGTQ